MGCSSSKPDATAAQKQAGAPEQAGPPDADTKDTRAAAAKDAFATVDKSGDGKVSMPCGAGGDPLSVGNVAASRRLGSCDPPLCSE